MAAQPAARKGFLVCIASPYYAIDRETGQAFEGAGSCLNLLCRVSDVVELSPTNSRASRSEWAAAGLPACEILPTRRRDVLICLAELMDKGYENRYTLLIGCGKHDLEAARSRGAFFYPILPGHEQQCWDQLTEEAMPKLLHGTFGGCYQQTLIARHNSLVRD